MLKERIPLGYLTAAGGFPHGVGYPPGPAPFAHLLLILQTSRITIITLRSSNAILKQTARTLAKEHYTMTTSRELLVKQVEGKPGQVYYP